MPPGDSVRSGLMLVIGAACAPMAACSAEDAAHEPRPSTAVEIRPGWYTSLNEPVQLLTGGGPLPIRQAPQGGQWAFVSAQVRGIGDAEMEIKARFFDVETGALSFAARRSGATVPVVGDPSFVEPALDSRGAIVHMPVCPIADSAGVFRRALRLVLEVSGSGEDGATEMQVMPDCTAGTAGERAVCECECAADFDPGKCY